MSRTRAFQAGDVVAAAQRDRWLVLDELDRAHLDRALGALSTFLGGLPVDAAGGSEVEPPPNWRIVATAEQPPTAPPRCCGASPSSSVPAPDEEDLGRLIERRPAATRSRRPPSGACWACASCATLGAGVFVAAARHGAARNAIEPAGEAELARELLDAYVRPLLGELDPDAEARLRALVP